MSTLHLKVPALGESIAEATIGRWKRSEGEAVKMDEPLVEVESDKATVEVPSPGTGILKRILKKPGETVPIGEIIAEIEPGAEARTPAPAAAAPSASAATPPAAPVAAPPTGPAAPSPVVFQSPPAAAATVGPAPNGSHGRPANGEALKASPALRRIMAEHDLGPTDVQPTGPAGRIERTDVERALTGARPAAQAPAPAPAAPPRKADPRERVVAMTPLRRTVARRLLEAQSTAAILTTFNEVDMTEVMALRERYQDAFSKKHGIKLGFMSFFVKAAVEALRAFPAVNAEVRGTDIIYKDFFDIGVAVGGGKGLVVPVVRDADKLSFAEVEKTIAALAGKAKENKLSLQELEGGTFTISNGGIYGSMMSTPILNPPQSGILGLHAIQKRPMAVGDTIAIRPMMYIALSYDHRIIDGREAVQFLVRIKDCVEDPRRILIEI
jgi:2-oxoglutarate dehydrogenase E2 component (dihydrolipoamide succinyltransferase)